MSNTITLVRPTKPRLPKRIGAKVDAVYAMRDQRIAYGKQIKEAEAVLAELKEREAVAYKELHAELRKQKTGKLSGDGSKGQAATFSVGSDTVFSVENWDEFYDYIAENDAFELLERRPARGNLKELLALSQENSEVKFPDGIKSDPIVTYSLVKASRK